MNSLFNGLYFSEAQEKQLRELLDFVDKYARHKPGCVYLSYHKNTCDCGYREQRFRLLNMEIDIK